MYSLLAANTAHKGAFHDLPTATHDLGGESSPERPRVVRVDPGVMAEVPHLDRVKLTTRPSLPSIWTVIFPSIFAIVARSRLLIPSAVSGAVNLCRASGAFLCSANRLFCCSEVSRVGVRVIDTALIRDRDRLKAIPDPMRRHCRHCYHRDYGQQELCSETHKINRLRAPPPKPRNTIPLTTLDPTVPRSRSTLQRGLAGLPVVHPVER
jgi:hypothetical protein